jgi:hypothetical protein
MREKVEALMPTPQAAQAWRDRLNFEVKSSELTNRALGNSRTAVRQAEQADAEGIASDLILDSLSGTPTMTVMRRLFLHMPTHIRDTLRSRSDRILADVLTNPMAANTADLQQILMAAQAQQAPRSLLRVTAPTNAITGAVEAP